MRVLIGVDGSTSGFEAVRQAGALLSGGGDEVALYYAPPSLHVEGPTAPDAAALAAADRALVEAVFNEAASQLPAALANAAERIVGHQAPRRGLLAAADEWQAELIAVGARGLGPIEQALLGSVSMFVAHAAKVPVLVARPRPGRQGRDPLRLLVACDGTEVSTHAAELLNRFSLPGDCTGRVIRVVESVTAGRVPAWLVDEARRAADKLAQQWALQRDEQLERHRGELREFCGDLPPAFADPEPIVVEGYPAEEILKAIDRESIDLVVVGARRLGAIQRLLLGSVSEKVLSHAPCSVLIARQHQLP